MESQVDRERAVQVLSLSVTELAAALRQQKLSALEVMTIYRTRAAEIHRACNAVTYWFDDAEQIAREADEHLKNTGRPLGPLHGVPFTIKDHVAMPGTPVTANVLTWKKMYEERLKKGQRPRSSTDPLVATLKSLGAIPLAKTNMSQMGDTWGCGGPAYGDTLNPWNSLRTPGGSSGGEGTMIGGGAAPFGIGSDVGGSLRIPSAFCGICTLRPTAGRLCLPFASFPGELGVPATLGFMAKTAEDVAFLHSVALSDELFDRTPRLMRIRFRASEAYSTRPLRIGYFIHEYTQPNPCPTARRAMQEVLVALRGAGHELVEFRPHSDGVLSVGELRGCDISMMSGRMVGSTKKDTESAKPAAKATGQGDVLRSEDDRASKLMPAVLQFAGEPIHPDLAQHAERMPPTWEVEDFTHAGSTRGPAAYLGALDRRDKLRERFYNAWRKAGLDVLVCPAFGFPAPQVEEVRHLHKNLDTTRVWNFLDMPAGVVTVTSVTAEDLRQPYDPCEGVCGGKPSERMVAAAHKCLEGAEGLPMAVQVVALPWREEMVLRGMREVEAGCPFDHRQHARLEPVPRRCPTMGARPEPVPQARL